MVSTILRQESATLFRFLLDTGEIARLKDLDHLGAIRFALEGAHHPRWEYIAVILALCDRAVESPDVHLSSKVQLPGAPSLSSGQEALKCWAMLLNTGHLTWTFAVERALLFGLWENRARRAEFESTIDTDPNVRAWAGRILKEGRTYQLFQALAFFRLRNLARMQGRHLAPEWLGLLRAYVLDGAASKQLTRLRAIYREIRRVAYMGLDSHYTPSVVSVDARQLFTDAATLARLVTREIAGTEDQLAGVERHLYRDVYLSEQVVREIAARERSVRAVIRGMLRRDGISATIEQLAHGDFGTNVSVEPLATVVRVPVFPVPPFEQILLRRLNPRTTQERFERKLGSDRRFVRVAIWGVPFGNDWVLQLHAPAEDMRACAAAYRSAFLAVGDLKNEGNRWLEYFDEISLHEYLFESLASNLLIGALNLLSRGNALRWEWLRLRGGPAAVFASRSAARDLLRGMVRRRHVPPDVMAELGATAALLRYRPQQDAAVAVSRLVGYEAGTRKQRLELDGLIVEVTPTDDIQVTIVEAKRKASGSQAEARKHLEKSLRTLGLGGTAVNVRTEPDVTWAWSVVTVSKNGDIR